MKSSSEPLYARSPQPLYLQVASIFRRNIERGVWPSGKQLPALEVLVEQLGVSRATVRQSFGLLEREGLIRRSRGTGTFVNENLPRKVRLALPRTWAETVALSSALGTTTLMESSAGVMLPPALAADCGADHSGHYQYLRRIHTTNTGPFCYSEVYLDHDIYRRHASRYRHSTVAPILDALYRDRLTHARQFLSIIEAGSDSAEALQLPLSSPVAELRRLACIDNRVIYYARLEIPTRYVQIEFDLLEQHNHA